MRAILLLLLLVAPLLAFDNPVLKPDDLDPAAFTQWVEGADQPVDLRDGPRHVIYTRQSAPEWDGVKFGEGKQPGVRYLRLGFKAPIAVGTILTRAGGTVSVLRATAAYPGRLDDDSQWLPATRLAGRGVSRAEANGEEYAVWLLPPGTVTRALRFAHTAQLTDRTFNGWLGGVSLLTERLANLAPQAVVVTSGNSEKADKIINGSNDGTWQAWDTQRAADQPVISADNPEWVLLTWAKPVTLRGLCALWAGIAAADAQVYTGPADKHPRDAAAADWQPAGAWDKLDSQYPRQLGPNWLDFGRTVTTRGVRLRLTQVTGEGHPHLNGNTKGGRRTWLGELLALSPLAAADLATAVLPEQAAPDLGHPPIPVRFNLPKAGYVTLVIEGMSGKRVRNLVADTLFAAGPNVVWWDGTDDLGRDPEAARHGIYAIPAQFVQPGHYRVRGLYRQAIDLKYQFSVYNSGNPVWETADSTGCWLTNHTPPSSALFVPADRSPNGKDMVYLGSYVAEGGHGLAWVDLEGRKQGGRGWVGGAWTGAPYLARDAGDQPVADTFVYVGAAWEGELRLTALTRGGDKQVVKYNFEGGKDASALTGLAVRNGLLIAALPKQNVLLAVDAKAGRVLGTMPLADPRGVAFQPDGKLLALSGKTLLRLTFGDDLKPVSETVIGAGLEDPQHLVAAPDGTLYVTDRGSHHQVLVFDAAGKPLRAVGRPGKPQAGPYDPLHINNPNGLTFDSQGRLWVAETDYQPKRVSIWRPDGTFVRAFYGPGQYGGGGTLDGRNPSRFYYNGMEFRLDWKTGRDQLVNVYHRSDSGDQPLPDGYGCNGEPEFPVYVGGRQYLTNCFDSNPTNGASIASIYQLEGNLAKPVAAVGSANEWSLLKADVMKPRWPEGIDLKGDRWRNQTAFIWSDTNDDRAMQPEEVAFLKAGTGGVTVQDDLSVVIARVDGTAKRLAPTGFSKGGAPLYDWAKAETLATDVQGPTSSGGDQALTTPDGWTILSVAPKPFAPQSLCGTYQGQVRWSYPNPWPGLHASHESPVADRPGMIIGTTRLLGTFVSPKQGEAGPLWCINGNQGNMYLFTADGLFVAELFRDVRVGRSWSMPVGQRDMVLNDVSLHDENFWPSITQTPDGTVYLVDGGRTSLVKVEGLESIRRIAPVGLDVKADDLAAARAWCLEAEAKRQAALGSNTLSVPLRPTAPTVDGKLDDWAGADWATVDKRGVAAYFDSNTKPYNVTASVTLSGDRLYAAWRTGDKNVLANTGDVPNALFKTGGGLDLMVGADAAADGGRAKPVAGDQRLLVALVKDKPRALLYRAVVPGTKEPVPFSSPWRTITLDQVVDVSDQVQLAGADGDFELSIPLATLGLKPTAGQTLRGDLGLLRGNGFQTLQRVYWSNKASGITADVPSEAELTPSLWGKWLIK